ncbi:MAG: 16S rRNA (cytosine(967)-C(5))-methyltransferase RsmB, partial [Firmicutes bacterium]|nr:16S rRNA (cytosine(967)-C(5))-methyltransferase RsmB [Bacillota bacterium]
MADEKRDQVGAREVALLALRDVDQGEAYAGVALDRARSRHPLSQRDRSLVTELVYGAVRRQNTLDWAISQAASRPLDKMPAWVRADLRLAAYQLLFLDRIPPSAAVNEAVELAKKYGHAGLAGFVNGVLRGLLRQKDRLPYPDRSKDPVGYLSLRHSHPAWMVRRWLERFGFEGTEALCRINNETPPLVLRPNRLKTNAAGLVRSLEAEGAEAEPAGLVPDAVVLKRGPSFEELASFQEGLFSVQDEGSMLVGQVLAPPPGETVLDACAAPGGKSTHLAELMGDQGKIIAVDPYEHKLDLIRDNARRLGTHIIVPELGDAREVGGRLAEQAGAVLVDAPCSGLGVLRRRPDARWRKQPEQIEELHRLQLEILEGAAKAVKPGGALVYSTCTIEPEENQGTVAAFLAEHRDFHPDSLKPYLPDSLVGEPGVDQGWLQLLPHVHGTDGFFIA